MEKNNPRLIFFKKAGGVLRCLYLSDVIEMVSTLGFSAEKKHSCIWRATTKLTRGKGDIL